MTVTANETHAEQAQFYRTALLLGLVRGDEVIRWAEDVLGGEKESAGVVRRVIGLIHRDLASGRRQFADTMTVLKQVRAFVKVDRDLNEHLKTLGVDVAIAPPDSPARTAAEQRVRDWLQQHA